MLGDLPLELVYRVAALAIGPQLTRNVSRAAHSAVDRLICSLRFEPAAPRALVRRRVARCSGVTRIGLARVACVDDELLGELLQAAGGRLRHLDLTGQSLELLRRSGLPFTAPRAWRMWQPSPELSPREVVELQVLALRDGSPEGIARCFAFASPENKQQTGPVERFGQMIRAGYSPMLAPGRVAVYLGAGESQPGLDEPQSELRALVVYLDRGEPRWFDWWLRRQPSGEFAGCWMTDMVMAAQFAVPGELQSGLERMAF